MSPPSVFSELYAAISAQDLDRAVVVYTPDVHYVEQCLGWEADGRQQVREKYGAWFDVAKVGAELVDTFAAGSRAAARWRFSGTIRAELPGIWTARAVGRSFVLSGATIAVLRHDGLIAEAVDFWNMADLLRQVT